MKQALLLVAIVLPLLAAMAWAASALPATGKSYALQLPEVAWPFQKQPFLLQVWCDPNPVIEPSYGPYPLAASAEGVMPAAERSLAQGVGALPVESVETAIAPASAERAIAPGWYPRSSGFRFSLRYQCTASTTTD